MMDHKHVWKGNQDWNCNVSIKETKYKCIHKRLSSTETCQNEGASMLALMRGSMLAHMRGCLKDRQKWEKL